jgi:hypothetical protein
MVINLALCANSCYDALFLFRLLIFVCDLVFSED